MLRRFFASSLSFFFPKAEQGNALAINAGLGNLGVSLVQFVVPLARPGDDVTPEDFVAFRFDGQRGLYIHANVWHEGVFALAGTQRFFDKQGAVHARVSVDLPREFGCLLEVPLA